MIKTAPYIETIGDIGFREFLSQSFSFETLIDLFDGWRKKDMINWVKYTNDDDVILEVFSEYYDIKTKKNSFRHVTPKTINDFINDMVTHGIQLYWTSWIDENFEPKQYLAENEIEKYYRDTLQHMGKSHELL